MCDNVDELTRATCAAIFSCLVYQNVPQEDAESSPEQVAAVFLTLALQSVCSLITPPALSTSLQACLLLPAPTSAWYIHGLWRAPEAPAPLSSAQVRTPEQQAAFDKELKDIDLQVEGVQVGRLRA